jgi:hypothetical protein
MAHIFEKGVDIQLTQRVLTIFLVAGFITTCLTKQVVMNHRFIPVFR